MRHFNRILGFVAVSFVLVFLGRVNKMGLYTAYFRTLADVEVRNSQALDHGDAHFEQGTIEQGLAPAYQPRVGGGSAALAMLVRVLVQPSQAEDLAFPEQPEIGQPLQLRCMNEVAPRAPSLS